MIDIIRVRRAIEQFEDNLRDGMEPENASKWAWSDTKFPKKTASIDEHFQRVCDAINPRWQKMSIEAWETPKNPLPDT